MRRPHKTDLNLNELKNEGKFTLDVNFPFNF